MFKNIKLYFIILLLFPFFCIQSVYSQECKVAFKPQTQSEFSKWMSPKKLNKVVESLGQHSNVVYQLEYKESPLNVRNTSDWIAYEALKQFANDAATTDAPRKYRVRHKTKSLVDKAAETAGGQVAIKFTQKAATAAQSVAQKTATAAQDAVSGVAQTYKQKENALTAERDENAPPPTTIDTLTTTGRAAAATLVSVGVDSSVAAVHLGANAVKQVSSAGANAVSGAGQTIKQVSSAGANKVSNRVSEARANRAAAREARRAAKAQTEQELLSEFLLQPNTPSEVLSQRIEELDLNTRINKRLKENNVYYIRDLTATTLFGLAHFNLGRRDIEDIKDALAKKGLSLGSYLPATQDAKPETAETPKPETAQDAKPETAQDTAQPVQETVQGRPGIFRRATKNLAHFTFGGGAISAVTNLFGRGVAIHQQLTPAVKEELAEKGLALRPNQETAQDAKPAETAQDTKPAETAQDTKPETAQAKEAQDAKPAETAQDTKPAETAQDTKPETAQAKEAQDAKPAETAQDTKPAETAQDTKPAETAAKQKPTETTQNTTQNREIPLEVANQKIEDYLDLGTRMNRLLATQGIMVMGELLLRTEQDILKVSGLGKVSVEKLKAALAKKGLTLM